MELDEKLKPHLDSAFETLIEISMDQVRVYVDCPDVERSEWPVEELPFCQQMTHIIVSGPDIEVTFKTHFMIEDIRHLVEKKLVAKDVSNEQIIDFIKEFCNMAAGKVKAVLETVGFELGQSLPFAIQGYNEVFYREPKNNAAMHQAWVLTVEEKPITCSATIELRTPSSAEQLSKIDFEPEYGKAFGDIELL